MKKHSFPPKPGGFSLLPSSSIRSHLPIFSRKREKIVEGWNLLSPRNRFRGVPVKQYQVQTAAG